MSVVIFNRYVIARTEPNKANQDSFAVVPRFCGDPTSLFCGVFDGHGGTGDLCSKFVAQNLPKVIQLYSFALKYSIYAACFPPKIEVARDAACFWNTYRR